MNKKHKVPGADKGAVLLAVLVYLILPIVIIGIGIYTYYIDIAYKKAIIDLGGNNAVIEVR